MQLWAVSADRDAELGAGKKPVGLALPKGFGTAIPPFSFLLLFFVTSTVLLFVVSFFYSRTFVVEHVWNVDNYVRLFNSAGFWHATVAGLKNGFFTAVFSVVLSFPVAYFIVYRSTGNALLYLVILSWFSSYLVRVYAWRTILGTNGVINSFLMSTGIVSEPLQIILFSPFATVLTLVHIMLPFSLLILVSALRDVRKEYLEAARDLGASGMAVLFKVILPMIHKGLIGAFMFTFIRCRRLCHAAAVEASTAPRAGFIADQFRKTGNISPAPPWPSC